MPHNDKSDFLSVALELTKMGFLVVPADSRHPIVKQWPNVATRDPAQIHKWGQKYANASVAIVVRADSDYWALDADVPDWLQQNWDRPLPKTAMVRSGGGGLHLYFQHDVYSREKLSPLRVTYVPNPDGNSEDSKLLEIYLDTHSLLAPGTVHHKTGIIYSWAQNRRMRPRPAPREFVAFLLDLPWACKSASKNTDGPHHVSTNACQVREEKNVNDLFSALGFKKKSTPEGFKFYPVRAQECPAGAVRHRGGSNTVWLFFYTTATRQLRFYCAGGSCAPDIKKDRTRAALEALNVKLDDWLVDNSLGKIIVGSARIHVIIEQCEQALCEAKAERFFQHGSDLVRVTLGAEQHVEHQPHEQQQTDQQEQDIRRPPDVPFLVPATSSSLHLALSRTERVFRRDKRGNITRSDPPKNWGSLIMDRLVTTPERSPWSRIRYVTNSPTLLPNGDVVETAGYHKESGIWFHNGGVEFPPIPQNPTRMQAREAMTAFEAIFCKFDFVTTKPGQKWNETPAFSALLSTILSVLVRNLVPTVPMLAINAPVAGTGKTLLANTISAGTTGSGPVLVPFDNTEEFDKLLPPLFRQGPRLVVVDNIEITLRSARLCAALTQEGPLTYRILGESRNVHVENSAVFIATGNNLGISGDLPRRTLEVRLDPNSEHPEYRQFDFDPLVCARQCFPQLAVSALTAIRAYFLAGCPTKDDAAMAAATFDFGSFTGWSRTVRGCLLWLGYADPLTTQECIEDPMRGIDLQILASWYDVWESEEHTINDIGRIPATELHTLLLGSNREWNPVVVSHILRKLRDKVIGDYKLVKTKESTHGTKYRVDYVGKKPAPRSGVKGERRKAKY